MKLKEAETNSAGIQPNTSRGEDQTSMNKSEFEKFETLEKEESYSLSRLLPEDIIASLNYLGLMISLVSKEYISRHEELC